MYLKIIINILLILILAVIQFSFISGLPVGLENLNLVLVVLIFILSLYSLESALWQAAGMGLILDIFSFLPFGVFLISLFLSCLAANFLLVNFFTNRSFYSFLALAAITSFFYGFIFNLINYFFQLDFSEKIFFIFNSSFWKELAYQTAFNLIAVIIIFYMVNFLSKKLKPAFLEKHKLGQI
jgi:rod shape-determining protein MreD